VRANYQVGSNSVCVLRQALHRKTVISDFPAPKTFMIPLDATPRDACIYIYIGRSVFFFIYKSIIDCIEIWRPKCCSCRTAQPRSPTVILVTAARVGVAGGRQAPSRHLSGGTSAHVRLKPAACCRASHPSPSTRCPCPLRRTWSSLDSLLPTWGRQMCRLAARRADWSGLGSFAELGA
jgi:hypothetical protein